MRTERALSRRLVTLATAVFLSMTACHSGPRENDGLADESIATAERDERHDRMLEEQRRLASELEALEKREAILKQRIAGQKEALAGSERQIRDLKQELRQKKAATNAYIDQHELQVACAYASDVARGEGEYSEKTRNCARVAAMYCAVAMLSPTFRRKVAKARQYVENAEAEAQSLKKQISSQEKKLETEKAELQAAQESLDRLAGEIAVLRQQLPAPPLAHSFSKSALDDRGSFSPLCL
jgi:peptidoglycan hydrolase CwlO-like protein